MEIFLNFIKSFFGSAGLIVGVFALVGSILLRRTLIKTIESTFLTVLGFFILSIGGAAIGSSLNNFSKMFSILIDASPGSSTIAASDSFAIAILGGSKNIAEVASIMLILAIIFNLLLAGLSRFKNIFLSTHIVMYFAIGITTMFMLCSPNNSLALDKYGLIIALIGAGSIAIYTTLAPSLTTQVANDLLKDKNINLCHHGLFSFALAGCIGKTVRKCFKQKPKSIEEINMPRWLGFLKNSNVTIVLTMLLLFVIVYTGAYIAHPREVSDYMDANGSVNSLGVALVLDAFIFTAGLLVLIYGVTMMVNELKECITGISRRFIPGAVLSVDASVILKTQPTAVMLGFIFSFLGCLITTIISYFLIKSNNIFSSVVLPSVIVFFFIGGTCGIFGNYYGGIYGCIISSFLIGLIVSFVPILFQTVFNTFSHPAYSNYWWTDLRLGFINSDYWNSLTINDQTTLIESIKANYPALVNNSFGESDYAFIVMFGWFLWAGENNVISSFNIMTIIALVIVVMTWTILIIDGYILNIKRKKEFPQLIYERKLFNLKELLRYYREKNNKYQNHINHLITNKELSVKKKQNLLNRKKNKKLIYLNKTKSIQQKMKSIKR